MYLGASGIYKLAAPIRKAMSSQISLPTCSCCFRTIMPNDKCVKFNCPDCNEHLIWRCESCRESARQYACPRCGFEGP